MIGFLNSRVKIPVQQDEVKLIKTIGNLTQTIKDILTLKGECGENLHWRIDVECALHYKMKSHTGYGFKLGKGSISSSRTMQKINSRSSNK